LAYFKVAMILHEREEFVQAADHFARVVEHGKTDAQTRYRAAYNAAVAYQKVTAWLDAAKMYTVVLGDTTGRLSSSSIHLKIGFCLVQASHIEEALGHFEAASQNPSAEEKPEILYWVGTCHAKLGEYQKAITEYLKVPYLYSGMGKWGVTAEFEAARLYERQGEYEKAVSLYRKIVRSDGEQGRFGRQAQRRIQRLATLTDATP
jgi:tetratricopeptide (TPR) repeat protein